MPTPKWLILKREIPTAAVDKTPSMVNQKTLKTTIEHMESKERKIIIIE